MIGIFSHCFFFSVKRGKNLTKAIGCTPLNAYVKVISYSPCKFPLVQLARSLKNLGPYFLSHTRVFRVSCLNFSITAPMIMSGYLVIQKLRYYLAQFQTCLYALQRTISPTRWIDEKKIAIILVSTFTVHRFYSELIFMLRHFKLQHTRFFSQVNLVPAASEKTYYRTCVRKNSMNPRFDQKFSMEITEADHSKRILFSVWHRDRAKG